MSGKSGSPKYFVTLAATTLGGMESQAERVNSSLIGYEFRLDHLKESENLEHRLRQLAVRLRFPQMIATCRRKTAGGLFRGTVGEQVEILLSAVRAGCQWVDLEVESLDRLRLETLLEFRPAKIIASYHNYRKTPALTPIYRHLARLPVQVVKVAAYARNLCDNLRVFRLLKSRRKKRSQKLVAMALGPSGLPSRILGLRSGSLFTYASPGDHFAVAPGQLPVEVIGQVYRADRLNYRTELYGVVGSHASYSLSPAMQNAAFQAKHLNAAYLPCETNRLGDFLDFARQMGFVGFSVTMPFKRPIIRDLDWLDPLASEIGACNTVAVERGKWLGWNTDAAAVVEVLTKRLRLAGSRLLILGAGGAARAAAYALRAEGAQVILAARREASARRLARTLSAEVVPWGSADGLDVDAVINATPVGSPPQVGAVPIDLARLRVRVVFDMVYYPLQTRLLAEARSRGLIAISGLEMLVAQGARQFEIWTAQAAPRALMEQAVRAALSHSPTR
ncbi:MAG: shikimate dehydrogenase [Acidobacteria bacterium]|nr:MAG: shikimate dehydrogenase [Acidobacteriota bacterium]